MSNRGVFQIDRRVWEEIGDPLLPNVHDTLLLPDAYQVVAVAEHKNSPTACVMKVYVESELIPDGLGVAELLAIYGTKKGQPFFDRMMMNGERGWERLPEARER